MNTNVSLNPNSRLSPGLGSIIGFLDFSILKRLLALSSRLCSLSDILKSMMSKSDHSLSVGIGTSSHTEAARAGKEAAEKALSQLKLPQEPKLALVFGSSWFSQPALLRGINSVLPYTPLIGGTTAGEISPQGPTTHSCVVLLLSSPGLTWNAGSGERVQENAREAGQQAAYTALREFQGSQRIGFLFFGDGLVGGFDNVARGIQEVLGTSSLVVGALTGDDMQFSHTTQYHNTRALNGSVVGVILGGTTKIGFGIEHGFAPISKPRHITRASSNILFELDHQPAATVYEEYFGTDIVQRMQQEGLSQQGLAYPLGMQNENTNHWLLRNVVSFREDGSLACSGELLEGSWLQLMISNRELSLDAATKAAKRAVQSLNKVEVVLVFNSASRKKLLGPEYTAHEIDSIRKVVGETVPIAGCYTYGEFAPLGTTSSFGRSAMQTGSVLVVALGA